MANQYNYDVSFRFVNNTRWGATLELLGWHTTRDNGIVLFLGPQDRVHLKQNANENYYYVVRHSEFKIESQFTVNMIYDGAATMTDVMPTVLPMNYQSITPFSPFQGLTVGQLKDIRWRANGHTP